MTDDGWDNHTAVGYIRSDWIRGGNDSFYLAFKGGNGQANHNDVDAGSFIFEMQGQRWAVT